MKQLIFCLTLFGCSLSAQIIPHSPHQKQYSELEGVLLTVPPDGGGEYKFEGHDEMPASERAEIQANLNRTILRLERAGTFNTLRQSEQIVSF
jgi:hypothetical protein